jgi:hypothetical protein
MVKDCPENKILNPATNRCVLKTSALGKKLLKGEEPTAKEPKQKGKKECPPEKLLNEKTGRCVKNTSANRKKIGVSSAPSTPASIPEPSIPEPVRKLTAKRPQSLVIQNPTHKPDNYIQSGSSSQNTALSYLSFLPTASTYASAPTGSTYASIPSASSYASIPSASSYASLPSACSLASPSCYYTPREYGVNEIDYSQPYHLAPQYTKKEYEEFKKRNKKIRANLAIIQEKQNKPTYMKSLFYKPIRLPESQVDILEGVANVNKYVRESNKPKVKRTNKRNIFD